jgi:hypothetical protein
VTISYCTVEERGRSVCVAVVGKKRKLIFTIRGEKQEISVMHCGIEDGGNFHYQQREESSSCQVEGGEYHRYEGEENEDVIIVSERSEESCHHRWGKKIGECRYYGMGEGEVSVTIIGDRRVDNNTIMRKKRVGVQ